MMMKTNTLLASAVAAGVLMMAAQGAAAHDKSKSAAGANAAASAIEQRMKMMEEQMQMMRSELSRVRAEAAKPAESSAKMADLEAKVAHVEQHSKAHHNLLFFRGGYAKNDHDRSGDLLVNGNGLLNGLNGIDATGRSDVNGGDDGWYFGAGFDFNLSHDVWGLLAGTPLADTAIDGELMFEYKKFDHQNFAPENPLGFTVGVGALAPTRNNSVTVTQFTLSAAPKVKFFESGPFRPWIIPIGFAMHVNSPPSDGVTYLNPGMMFGAGAEYRLWKDIFVGADARYHLTANDNDGVPTDGMTAGGYLGIGF
jgi:opacity protein-like surface antigen